MSEGPTADALLKMAIEMGRVAGQTAQINERVGEVGDAVKDLAETNAADHQRTAVQLAEIKQRLTEGDRRFDGLEKRVDTLETKLPLRAKSGGTRWSDILGLAKTYGPYVFGALVAIWAYLSGQTPKGDGSP